MGWISFGETGLPDNTFKSNCIGDSCSFSADCTACYEYNTGSIYGWAKILSLGDNGWLRFDHGLANPVTVSTTTGIFSGYAWNGNDDNTGMGWLSFDCVNNNVCDDSNYKVVGNFVNSAPEAGEMTAPNWSHEEACGVNGAKQVFLEWNFYDSDMGACEKAYQIIVNDVDIAIEDLDTSSVLLNTGKCDGSYSSGECSGGSFSQNGNNKCRSTVTANKYDLRKGFENNDGATQDLEYDETYFWWVKVWDERGLSSEWHQYDTSISAVDEDTDNDDGDSLTFTTYAHDFPHVDFGKYPSNPAIGENVTFSPFATSSQSRIYSSGSDPILCTPLDCSDSVVDWYWSFEQAIPPNSSTSTPTVKFLQAGTLNATLTVTHTDIDNNIYSCTATDAIENISVCLPLWQEKNPEDL